MSFDVQELKPENAKAIIIVVASIVILGFGLYYVNKVLGGFGNAFSSLEEALGITDSPARAAQKAAIAAAAAEAANPSSPWSPDVYENTDPGPDGVMPIDTANTICEQIWDSISFWGTRNIDQVISALKQINTKLQLSYIVQTFNTNYQKDLFTWINTQYTSLLGGPDPGLATINSYVAALPAS